MLLDRENIRSYFEKSLEGQEVQAKPERNGGLNEESSSILEEVLSETHLSFVAGVPSPAVFRRYEEILPGMADRIMEMAENEQNMVKEGTRDFISNENLRIWGLIAVSLSFIAGAVYCAMIGQQFLGGVLGISGVVSIIPELIGPLLGKDGRLRGRCKP